MKTTVDIADGLPAGFKLRRAGFRGSGRQPEFAEASWGRISDTVYQDHEFDRSAGTGPVSPRIGM